MNAFYGGPFNGSPLRQNWSAIKCTLAFGYLALTACGESLITSPEQAEIAPRTAHDWDLMLFALSEIEGQCPAFGAVLWEMYNNDRLGWGELDPGNTWGQGTYGTVANPGIITMDGERYGNNVNDLDMLIGDLFHEAGHSLGNLFDDDESFTDGYGRENMHWNAWDDTYSNNGCPNVST